MWYILYGQKLATNQSNKVTCILKVCENNMLLKKYVFLT
jgi:hypothetical protein